MTTYYASYMINEDALIERVTARDQDALSELFQNYANLVFDVAYRVLQDPALAEEVTQDTFLKVWNQAHTWDSSRGRLATWLMAISRHTAIDRLRKEARRPSAGGVDLDDVLNMLESGDTIGDPVWQDSTVLNALIRELSADQLQVVELAFFNGLSHSEIAEHLHLPLGTVKGRMRAALHKLRDLWERANG